ncbi:MAG: cell division protein FtsQ [Polaribacter sp.]|jgi:cell division protein FtsQ
MKFKRILKYLLLVVLVGFFSFLYGFSSARNSVKKVTKIEVKFEDGNNNFLTHAMVDKLLIQNKKTVANQTKSAIDLYKLERNVSKNPYIEKATVFLTIGGVLKATIKQRTPIARIITGEGSYYIDKQGVKVPLSGDYSARVLLISGVSNEEDVRVILPLIITILEDDFLQKEIVGIVKSNTNDYEFSLRSGDYKIDFGQLTDVALKFKKLKAFYNTTFKDKTIQEYKTIALKYHNQVVCTK